MYKCFCTFFIGINSYNIDYSMNKWFHRNGFMQYEPRIFLLLYPNTNLINITSYTNSRMLKFGLAALEDERDIYVHRFLYERIQFYSMRGLSDNDLQLLGIDSKEKRIELLNHLKKELQKYPSFNE